MLLFVKVLARVCRLVLEVLDEAVEDDGEHAAERGAQPVDPLIAAELCVGDVSAEGARWVQRASSVVDAWFRVDDMWVDSEGRRLPASSAMKSARPMPIGARNVPLCFSAASMKLCF